MREADLDKHLGSGQGEEQKDEARERPVKKPASAWKKKPRSLRPSASCLSLVPTRISS